MMLTCLICRQSFDPSNTKPEHILLNALGGKKKTRTATCSKCNEDAGGSIDSGMAESVNLIRNFFGWRSGDGNDAPAIQGIPTVEGGTINLKSDGSPDDKSAEVEVIKKGNTIEFRGGISNYARFVERLPHLARQAGISEEQLIEALTKNGLEVQVKKVPTIHGQLSFGTDECLASVAKMGLVLWSERIGNAQIYTQSYQPIAEALLSAIAKTPTPIASFCRTDARTPSNLQLPTGKDWGDFYNVLRVFVNEQGEVCCWFRLYNSFNYYVTLGMDAAYRDQSILLISNPDTLEWELIQDFKVRIPDAWFSQPHPDVEEVKAAVGRLIETSQKRQRKKHQEKLVSEAIKESFPKDGEIIEREHIAELSTRAAEAIVGDLTGLGHKKTVPQELAKQIIDEIKAKKKKDSR